MAMTKNRPASNAQPFDPRLDKLARICTDRIDELLLNLDVDLCQSGNKYIGNCPIHGNSDSGSFNLYHDGYAVPGYWKCRSKNCQSVFKPTIIGFTRGRLSHLELGYVWGDQANPKKLFSFKKTLDYLCNFAKVNFNNIKVDPAVEERRRFLLEYQGLTQEKDNSTIHRTTVQKNLIIPAEYFLNRGFSQEVLRSFDVGLSKRPKIATNHRVIVPIYNEKEYLVGYTSRSVFEKCQHCSCYHEPTTHCPKTEIEKSYHSKWCNHDFNVETTLYNYWSAKPYIQQSNTVVLVEGPGDVWKLAQNGFNNVIGMFGNTLRDKQERLLSKVQTMNLCVMNDTDEAGLAGARLIKENFGRLYNIYFPRYEGKDVGGLTDDTITDRLKPMVDGIMKVYQ